MASTIPKRIEIQVYADDLPAGGLLCMLTSEASYKNSFNSVVGPSNENGKITITGDEILTRAHQDSKLFLMDYGNPEDCITGKFTISPLTVTKLQSLKDAYKSFHKAYNYPQDYLESINNAIEFLSTNSISRLKIKVVSVDGSAKINTVTEIIK